MKTYILIVSLICAVASGFAQTAFDEAGVFVANPDYSIDEIKSARIGDNRVIILWSQNDAMCNMAVWAHIFDAGNELITEEGALRISPPDCEGWIG